MQEFMAESAFGEPVVQGQIKTEPEHFQVREWLGFEADGAGDHVLVTVRKRNANTMWVARALARHARTHPREVGFAGLKDRHALTEQAFTLPWGQQRSLDEWQGFGGEGFEVLSAVRQRRKLRRGAHRGNDFRIVVDRLEGDLEALQERLKLIAQRGVPNYFGVQRFGRDGGNLDAATQWFTAGREPRDRAQRGFALSAARAAIFNAVLAERVRSGAWDTLLAGDVANLDGSNSVFSVENPDALLLQRCAELDIHPTGPLWGRGELRSREAVAELENAVAQRYVQYSNGLAAAGLNQERRSLRMSVRNLAWTCEHAQLILEFRLSKGSFATALLQEILGKGISGAATGVGEDEDA